MYICNMHGEPLLYDSQRALWKCPEYIVCGTYVTDEFVHLRAKKVEQTWEKRQREIEEVTEWFVTDRLYRENQDPGTVIGVALEHSIQDPFTGEITATVLLGNPLDESVKAFLDDYLWKGRRREATPEDYDQE